MAYISCPECRKQISVSDPGTSCPNCGTPVEMPSARVSAGMRLVSALVWIAILVFALMGCSSTPEPEPADNAPPTVTLEANRLEGEATFHATFEAQASDSDDDPLSYTWRVNGVTNEGKDGATATLAFEEAGTFVVSVEVSDGWRTTASQVTVRARNDYRPEDSPDVVILGFAGRCTSCIAPAGNYDALGNDPTPGTLTAIAHTFDDLGYSTATYSFRSHLFDNAAYGNGYLSADAKLRFIRDTWIGDFLDPTRIVLVAHSHGTQFMSLLAYDHPEVQVAYGIYLDAVCTWWDSDHIKSGLFDNWYGNPLYYPSPLDTTTYACDSLPVQGVTGLHDISDVVPWNVTWGLELVSSSVIHDNDPNMRPNGATGVDAGLSDGYAAEDSHTEVHTVGSAGLSWVLDTITLNGLPSDFTTSQAGPTLRPAPLPPGFRPEPPNP